MGTGTHIGCLYHNQDLLLLYFFRSHYNSFLAILASGQKQQTQIGIKLLLNFKEFTKYVTSSLEYKVEKSFPHFEVNILRILILSCNLVD